MCEDGIYLLKKKKRAHVVSRLLLVLLLFSTLLVLPDVGLALPLNATSFAAHHRLIAASNLS